VRKINFTGSTATGRKIARACGQALKPCLMELGGKNSAIICADANLEVAIPQVIAGSFWNVNSSHPLSRYFADMGKVRTNLHGYRSNPRSRLNF
jgi:hypothetical protein